MDSRQRSLTNSDGLVSKGVVDLPMEIISDILSRLPIESILTCKSVCKTWYGIIQDPYFINKLCNSHHQPNRLILKPLPGKDISDSSSHLVLVDIEEHKTRRIPIEKKLLGYRIMCSCNGLLCLAMDKKLSPVVIYNPITREHIALPPSASKHAIRNHKVGLGFDISTGKYKVVNAYSFLTSFGIVTKFEIISLGDKSWRQLTVPHSIADLAVVGVVFWNGSLYWKLIDVLDIGIVEFNVSNEKFHLISFEEAFSQPQAPLELMDLGGYLALVEHPSGQIKLWRYTGNRTEGDRSFCLQRTFDTQVNWGKAVYYAVISESKDDSYLLKVGYRNSQCQRFEHLTRYFPQRTQYLYLDIPGLPPRFYSVYFKPSLVSPVAASLSLPYDL